MKNKLIIGSRSSKLALWQSNFIKSEIEKQSKDISVEIKKIKTKGDKILDVALSKIGDKGLFTKELENELLYGTIDIAVHSLKDLETIIPEGLKLAVVTKRHKVNDVFIAKKPGITIDTLPKGATVATGSLRRKSQLQHLRPDITILDLRGNVPTRIQKLLDSDWDAIILACAGVERLNLVEHISSYIPINQMLPAVGQGALGIEIKKGNQFAVNAIQFLHDENTYLAVTAERSLLRSLQGGCQVPIGAHADVISNKLKISAMVGSINGDTVIKKEITGDKHDSEQTGKMLANALLNAGAKDILDEIYQSGAKD